MNTLQERLRDLYVSHGISHIQEAADRIDADAERIKALEAENAALRKILLSGESDAQFLGMPIHRYGVETHQNWFLEVYLPVPLSEPDKSIATALHSAINEARGKA